MSCGACCAYFRVSFYWGESDLHPEGFVLVDKLDERFAVMKGTDQQDSRCSCLSGELGSFMERTGKISDAIRIRFS
jgi:hypothetical protein